MHFVGSSIYSQWMNCTGQLRCAQVKLGQGCGGKAGHVMIPWHEVKLSKYIDEHNSILHICRIRILNKYV